MIFVSITKYNLIFGCFLLLIFTLATTAKSKSSSRKQNEMVLIKGGDYKPLYSGSTSKEIKVNSFYMDKYAVTNAEFLEFVKENPKWRKSNVKKLFADKSYLANWESDLELGKKVSPNAPVTNVSWFVAKAYCEKKGKRLPTVAEWEYAAQASSSKQNGGDKEYYQEIVNWYSTPTEKKLSDVGSKGKNYWGVFDMHGLIWEWTYDFYGALVTGESRGNNGLERNLFCGSGAAGASDYNNYPAFLRFAFRSCLKANYTTSNLGFRGVKDFEK